MSQTITPQKSNTVPSKSELGGDRPIDLTTPGLLSGEFVQETLALTK